MLSYEEAKKYIGKYVLIQCINGNIYKGRVTDIDEFNSTCICLDHYEDSEDGVPCPIGQIETITEIPKLNLHSFALDNTGFNKFYMKEEVEASGSYFGNAFFQIPDFPLKLHEAILYSYDMRKNSKIKGINIDYPLFLMEVVSIICGQRQPSITLPIAALLQGIFSELEIKAKFGEDIFDVINEINNVFCEDNISLPWKERSSAFIKRLKNSSFYTRVIILADFICTFRHIVISKDMIGDKIWNNFDMPKEEIEFFSSELIDSYYDFKSSESLDDEYWELNSLHKILFVNYYYLKKDGHEFLYQADTYHVSILAKDNPIWTHTDTIDDNATLITKQIAETLDNLWYNEEKTKDQSDLSEYLEKTVKIEFQNGESISGLVIDYMDGSADGIERIRLLTGQEFEITANTIESIEILEDQKEYIS